MTTRRILLALATLTVLLASSGAASAHASKAVGDGSITIVWGWTGEPAVTMTKNGLEIAIRDTTTREGIGGLEGTNLTVKIHKGELEYDVPSLATVHGKGPGNYTSSEPVTPTQPGIYVLHVAGKINGQEIDVEIPHNHEVHDIAETYFPEVEESGLEARIAALEAEVAALKARAQTQAATPATVESQPTASTPVPAPAVALMAVAVVGVALALRRK